MSNREEDYKRKYGVLVEWLWKYKRGESIKRFLEDNNYNHIIIYGMGLLGELLMDEVSEYVEICFDQKEKDYTFGKATKFSDADQMGDELGNCNLAIITLIDADREIESSFYRLGFQGDVLHLYDIVKFYV